MTVRDMLVRRRVVVRHDPQPARHGLDRDGAERLRVAREQEHVGRRIMRGEILTGADPSKHQVGVGPREPLPRRAVPHRHEAHRTVDGLDGPVGVDGELNVLLGRHPADVGDYEIAVAGSPGGAERRRAARRREQIAVDATAEQAHVVKPAIAQCETQIIAGDEGGGGLIVEAPQIRRDRSSQPRRPVMRGVAIELCMKPADHGDTERAGRADSGATERALRRDVDDVRSLAGPGRAECASGRESEAEAPIARQWQAVSQRRRGVGSLARAARADERDVMSAHPKAVRQAGQCEGDAVDLRRVRLRHDGDVRRHTIIVVTGRVETSVKSRLPICIATATRRNDGGCRRRGAEAHC